MLILSCRLIRSAIAFFAILVVPASLLNAEEKCDRLMSARQRRAIAAPANADPDSIEELLQAVKEIRAERKRLEIADVALSEVLRRKSMELQNELNQLGLGTGIGAWQAPMTDGPRWSAPVAVPPTAAVQTTKAPQLVSVLESGHACVVRNIVGVQGPMVQIVFGGVTIEARHLQIKLKDKTLDLTAGKEAMTVVEAQTGTLPAANWTQPAPATWQPIQPTPAADPLSSPVPMWNKSKGKNGTWLQQPKSEEIPGFWQHVEFQARKWSHGLEMNATPPEMEQSSIPWGGWFNPVPFSDVGQI